ncbi:WD40-repeat-containing domain protein [Scleroderma yunnanense]
MESDSAFVAPEGVYSVTEEHRPAGIPAHTGATASSFPTRLSAITIRFNNSKQAISPGFAQLLGSNLTKDSKKDKEKEKEKERERDERSLSSTETHDTSPDVSSQLPLLTQDSPTSPEATQPSLFVHPSTLGKKKVVTRPKHNIRTTSSTFITRVQSVEGLGKILSNKQGDTTFLFYNCAKTFFWMEVGSKSKEPLTRITFSAFPTCHDINLYTASSERLDVIIGFHTGDLVWFDPFSNRYGRLNKQGAISSSPCTAVRWVPSSSTLFLVSHADGTIVVYDKERDDGVFSPSIPSTPPPTSNLTRSNLVSPITPEQTFTPSQPQGGIQWDPLTTIHVTTPPWHPESVATGKERQDKGTAKNPVSHWRVSKRGVLDFIFSPDVKYVAAISEDGCLRVIDALAEQLVDCYASYFGALTCVAWSPDGRFILTGGQDDLLTIFSPWEQRVVARCQGHSSFVSAVAFDELRCDGRTYRFGSVGEDNKLILWDFSSGALHRPKSQSAHHTRVSMASSISLGARRTAGSVVQLTAPKYHPAPPRNGVSVVQPVLVKQTDSDLLTSLMFLPRALVTATKGGHIRVWVRPLVLAGNSRRRGHGRQALSISDILDVMALYHSNLEVSSRLAKYLTVHLRILLHHRTCHRHHRPSFVHHPCLPCWRRDQLLIPHSLRHLSMTNGPLTARFLSPRNLPRHRSFLLVVWHGALQGYTTKIHDF